VLQRLRGFGDAALCLLGNHDLHLLAVAQRVRPAHRSDTLDEILASPEREAWLDWLRHRPLAATAHGWLLVHAGVVPQWTTAQTLALADEVHTLLAGPDLHDFLVRMYGNEPAQWRDTLQGTDRWRFVINVLTRIRFCSDDGVLEFASKDGAAQAPSGYRAWFDVPARRTQGTPIAIGHWSTLGLVDRPDLLAIDTGCVWGGALTAVRIDGGRREVTQVRCEAAQVL
jgi:bis(5'-nucleosyl)-tetraphosphatase (symmetrical)